MRADNSAVWCISLNIAEAQLAVYELALEPLNGAIVVTNPDAAGMIETKVYVDGQPSQKEINELLANTAEILGGTIPQASIEQLANNKQAANKQLSRNNIAAKGQPASSMQQASSKQTSTNQDTSSWQSAN